jgi:DNA repair protein RadC
MNVRLSQDQKIKVLNSEDVYNIMQQILLRENKIRRNQEHFWVVGLDNKNKILFIELISLGAVNSVQVKPREIFRMAIYKMAVQMILVHNHPSGEVDPSEADKDMTDRLLKSEDMLGIEVIEHLIISEKEYLSFEDTGIISELKRSGKYELIDREKNDLRQLKIEVAKERAAKDKSIEIAKKLKEDGHDIDTIKKYTGLSKWDIKKI